MNETHDCVRVMISCNRIFHVAHIHDRSHVSVHQSTRNIAVVKLVSGVIGSDIVPVLLGGRTHIRTSLPDRPAHPAGMRRAAEHPFVQHTRRHDRPCAAAGRRTRPAGPAASAPRGRPSAGHCRTHIPFRTRDLSDAGPAAVPQACRNSLRSPEQDVGEGTRSVGHPSSAREGALGLSRTRTTANCPAWAAFPLRSCTNRGNPIEGCWAGIDSTAGGCCHRACSPASVTLAASCRSRHQRVGYLDRPASGAGSWGTRLPQRRWHRVAGREARR